MGKEALRTAAKVDLKAEPWTLPYLHVSGLLLDGIEVWN
jgi:hypothetical protein